MKLKNNVSNYDTSSNLPFMKKRPAKRGFPREKYFARFSLLHKVQIHVCPTYMIWFAQGMIKVLKELKKYNTE